VHRNLVNVKPEFSKSCLLIMRLPFLEKVPNALYLVRFLADRGYAVRILSTSDPMYPLPEAVDEQVSYEAIPRRERGERIPTSIRLLARALSLVRREPPCCILGLDPTGNIIASMVKKLTGVPYANFVLEYPQPRHKRRGVFDRLEAHAFRCADIVITHDRYHSDFLVREVGVPESRIHRLPNGSGPRGGRPYGSYFRDQLGLADGDRVILHSGGFGPWFCCHELAAAAARWEKSRKLVFHTSHHVDSTPYAAEFRAKGLDKCAILHSRPVPDSELDALVGSAHIGLAIYSLELLGFRAEYLGLAAGKIGRCLKNGIPVIATNTVSLRDYIESYRCGLCVNRPEEVGEAISRIFADYDSFRSNAFRCYDELWNIEKPCAELLARIEGLKAKR
jgi:glycosyltransferase involved in cell wall biosynthesis